MHIFGIVLAAAMSTMAPNTMSAGHAHMHSQSHMMQSHAMKSHAMRAHAMNAHAMKSHMPKPKETPRR